MVSRQQSSACCAEDWGNLVFSLRVEDPDAQQRPPAVYDTIVPSYVQSGRGEFLRRFLFHASKPTSAFLQGAVKSSPASLINGSEQQSWFRSLGPSCV